MKRRSRGFSRARRIARDIDCATTIRLQVFEVVSIGISLGEDFGVAMEAPVNRLSKYPPASKAHWPPLRDSGAVVLNVNSPLTTDATFTSAQQGNEKTENQSRD